MTGSAPPRDALVVGGGFGGLAAALALRRAGIEPQVIERRPAGPTTSHGSGGGLTLWANAISVLRGLGVADQVIEAGSILHTFDNRTAGGDTMATWRVDRMTEGSGLPNVNIEWDVLHRVLSDAVGPDAVHRATCAGFEPRGERVAAVLEDGSERTAGLLVGADGIRSVVRAGLFGPSEPRYAGYDVLRAVIPDEHPDVPAGLFVQMWGTGARFGYYRVGGGATYWFAVVNAGDGAAYPRRRDFLEARMAGWAGPVTELVRATPEDAISRLRVHDRDPITVWGAGRATLLGDAAHPMTFNVGQGACQAIEDAAQLARSAARSYDANGLRDYEAARQARTAALVRRARRIGAIARWRSPAACAVRNSVLSLTLAGPGRRQHASVIAAA